MSSTETESSLYAPACSKTKAVWRQNKVTATVMSNIGFHKAMEESGIDVDVTGVGDRYVLEQMLKSGCVHRRRAVRTYNLQRIYHYRRRYTLIPAVYERCSHIGRKTSELAAEIEIFPQVLVNARVNNENKKKYCQ